MEREYRRFEPNFKKKVKEAVILTNGTAEELEKVDRLHKTASFDGISAKEKEDILLFLASIKSERGDTNFISFKFNEITARLRQSYTAEDNLRLDFFKTVDVSKLDPKYKRELLAEVKYLKDKGAGRNKELDEFEKKIRDTYGDIGDGLNEIKERLAEASSSKKCDDLIKELSGMLQKFPRNCDEKQKAQRESVIALKTELIKKSNDLRKIEAKQDSSKHIKVGNVKDNSGSKAVDASAQNGWESKAKTVLGGLQNLYISKKLKLDNIMMAVFLVAKNDNFWWTFFEKIDFGLKAVVFDKISDHAILLDEMYEQLEKLETGKTEEENIGNYKGAMAEILSAVNALSKKDYQQVRMPGLLAVDQKFRWIDEPEDKKDKQFDKQDVDRVEVKENSLYLIEVKSDIQTAINKHGSFMSPSDQIVRYVGVAATYEKEWNELRRGKAVNNVHLAVEIVNTSDWEDLFISETATLYGKLEIELRLDNKVIPPEKLRAVGAKIKVLLTSLNADGEELTEEKRKQLRGWIRKEF